MSNRSGINTREYRHFRQLSLELATAVKDDLIYVSSKLVAQGVITPENHDEFTNFRGPILPHERAANLVNTVLNRIKVDSRNFETFVKVLKEKEWYYETTLKKLKSCNVHDVRSGSLPILNDVVQLEQSDSETSTLLHTSNQQKNDDDNDERKDNYSSLSLFWCSLLPLALILFAFLPPVFLTAVVFKQFQHWVFKKGPVIFPFMFFWLFYVIFGFFFKVILVGKLLTFIDSNIRRFPWNTIILVIVILGMTLLECCIVFHILMII